MNISPRHCAVIDDKLLSEKVDPVVGFSTHRSLPGTTYDVDVDNEVMVILVSFSFFFLFCLPTNRYSVKNHKNRANFIEPPMNQLFVILFIYLSF